MGASRLYSVARVLRVDVSFFFRGLDCQTSAAGQSGRLKALREFIASPDGLEVAKAFQSISSSDVRRNMIELMRALG